MFYSKNTSQTPHQDPKPFPVTQKKQNITSVLEMVRGFMRSFFLDNLRVWVPGSYFCVSLFFSSDGKPFYIFSLNHIFSIKNWESSSFQKWKSFIIQGKNMHPCFGTIFSQGKFGTLYLYNRGDLQNTSLQNLGHLWDWYRGKQAADYIHLQRITASTELIHSSIILITIASVWTVLWEV